jgi:hypothetical protein
MLKIMLATDLIVGILLGLFVKTWTNDDSSPGMT